MESLINMTHTLIHKIITLYLQPLDNINRSFKISFFNLNIFSLRDALSQRLLCFGFFCLDSGIGKTLRGKVNIGLKRFRMFTFNEIKSAFK